MSLKEALERKIIVCLGSGGVGKTTTAAVLALEAARSGKKVLVMTIDPARRLRSALGIPEVGNFESRVDPAIFEAAGIPMAGEFHAMMLDTKSAFDDVIARVAPDGATHDAILKNRLYQYVSTTLAGSREYVAAERLYDIYRRGVYDLVVVDTPPTKNALDFLEGPGRMSKFLDDRIMKIFLLPMTAGSGLKEAFIRRTSAVIYRILAVVFGDQFLGDMNSFVWNFRDMYGEFRRRADDLSAILRSDAAAFMLVTSLEKERTHEAGYLARQLLGRGYRLNGVVINRVNTVALGAAPVSPEEIEKAFFPDVCDADRPLARRTAALLVRRFDYLRESARRDAGAVAALAASWGAKKGVHTVPAFDADIHDLKGLDLFRKTLFDGLAGG
ncbi:MAG: ArsA family ATPase [Deltaproteobacteria bacterium]|nr:ArsA family ATPase [Deltaproteobacteria bacterium]